MVGRSFIRLVLGFILTATLLPEQAFSVEPKEPPGPNELIITPPKVDSDNKNEKPTELEQETHLHRLYYSGDKEYQGPNIKGGPTIVAATHPATSEHCEVRVVLPPGAPLIVYNKQSITYAYPDKRIRISFSRPFSNKVKVYFLRGKGIHRTLSESSKKIKTKIRETGKKSKLVHTVKTILSERKDLAKGVVGVAETVADTGLSKANQVFNMLPGVALLKSAGERAAESQHVEEIRQAGFDQADDATKFISTVR